MNTMFQFLNEKLIRILKALGMKSVVNKCIAHAPSRIQKWAENKIMERRILNRQRLVPEKALTSHYHAALLTLLEKHGAEALGDYLEFGVYIGVWCIQRDVTGLYASST